MKELQPNIDENKLWRMCFPYCFAEAQREGVYVVISPEAAERKLKDSGGGRSPLERAVSRLDMAIAYLWPHVSDLFLVDFFPHRLAAATDILRAVDFGEGQEPTVGLLAKELAESLDALEQTLAAYHAWEGVQAAEPDPFTEE